MPLHWDLHEMSIAAAVLDAVRAEAERRPGSRISRAGLRIGELSGVQADALRFCLETLVSGTDMEPLAFDFELLPWMRRCKQCGETYRVVDYQPACAACGSSDTEAAGGDEMELSYVEVEEPDARAPGTQSPQRE
jgi:hydrogenase nickel incorporation protein HypA/HybF